jgi:hypothetical protein
MGPSPDDTKAWIDVLKNVMLIGVGIFIIIHETLGADFPSLLLLIVAAGALGLPVLDYLSGIKKKNDS